MTDQSPGRLFHSVEDMHLHNHRDTLEACRQNGFDVFQPEAEGHTFAGKHSTAEVVDVYPDGSWSYRDSTPENPAAHTIATGINASFFRLFCHNPEMYVEESDD